MDREARQELYLTMLLLGADPMLLGAVERMQDGNELLSVRNWNEAKLLELKEWLPTMNGTQFEAVQERIRQYESLRRTLKKAA
jgi:hypothetical protein